MNNNVVFIIPTGIGCAIGGHAGDATPAAKLIASVCNKIILHPNVVNASDINEMPSNALYVEGSLLDGFLRGEHKLLEVNKPNKVLVVVNKPIQPDTINAINASACTVGMDVEIIELDVPLKMRGYVENGIANGKYSGIEQLIEQVNSYKFDALAIATEIEVSDEQSLNYFRTGGVNPWGGIEAIVSREIATALMKPVAHAPIESQSTKENDQLFYLPFNEIVNPRMAAEVISNCYLHCVMKGLHRAPHITEVHGIGLSSISAMVSPFCFGEPHRACIEAGIPVIIVKENTTTFTEIKENYPEIIYVNNYLEAAGVISCINSGVTVKSVLSDKYL